MSTLIANLRPLLHPMLVHFPIALLFASVALDALGWLLRRPSLTRAGFFSLVLGTAVAKRRRMVGTLQPGPAVRFTLRRPPSTSTARRVCIASLRRKRVAWSSSLARSCVMSYAVCWLMPTCSSTRKVTRICNPFSRTGNSTRDEHLVRVCLTNRARCAPPISFALRTRGAGWLDSSSRTIFYFSTPWFPPPQRSASGDSS